MHEAVNNEYVSKIQKRGCNMRIVLHVIVSYFIAVPVPEDAREKMVNLFF